jgi:hypothetical protein
MVSAPSRAAGAGVRGHAAGPVRPYRSSGRTNGPGITAASRHRNPGAILPRYRMVMTPERSQASEKSPETPPQGFNLLVVPVLLGFSLTTIVLVVTGPKISYADRVAIYFLTVSTGLLLGSFQLSTGSLRAYGDEKDDANKRKHPWLDGLRTFSLIQAPGVSSSLLECLFVP